jgi:hypothetical protein
MNYNYDRAKKEGKTRDRNKQTRGCDVTFRPVDISQHQARDWKQSTAMPTAFLAPQP